MRLFHVSENRDIKVFLPRILNRREDIEQGKGLVWAVNHERLYNLLFPTNCPRLSTFKTHHGVNYLKDADEEVMVVIEKKWQEAVKNCSLTIYEFDPKNFVLQDETAGYDVSSVEESPIASCTIKSCLEALQAFEITVRVEDNLWQLRDEIMSCTEQYSFRKMIYAQPRIDL